MEEKINGLHPAIVSAQRLEIRLYRMKKIHVHILRGGLG
jgi:hypothetical protein